MDPRWDQLRSKKVMCEALPFEHVYKLSSWIGILYVWTCNQLIVSAQENKSKDTAQLITEI